MQYTLWKPNFRCRFPTFFFCYEVLHDIPYIICITCETLVSDLGCRTFLFCYEVLYDDVGHVVAEGVAVFIEAMDGAEDELVVGDSTVLTSHRLK